MNLKTWRCAQTMTLTAAAGEIGISGANPARTLQRFEEGSQRPDAPLVEAIAKLTDGAVTAQDMHETRLDWLRANGRGELADA